MRGHHLDKALKQTKEIYADRSDTSETKGPYDFA